MSGRRSASGGDGPPTVGDRFAHQAEAQLAAFERLAAVEVFPAAAGELVGHVHWADSNRRAVGFGHTGVAPCVAALRAIGYAGFLSAEVLPLPTPFDAARRSIESFRALVRDAADD